MSEGTITKAIRLPDGRIVEELDDGTTRPIESRTDWARVDAMTDEEVEANALADPDNPPISADELRRMKPVPNTREIRKRLRLSQEQFAVSFQLPLGTVRDWELGRREPDTAAKNFLRVIERNPEAVIDALRR
jgi:putative transcriptional regulator